MAHHKPKRHHHELPRLYLKGFCEDLSFVWVYECGKPFNPGKKKSKYNPYRCGIVKEIAEKDTYAYIKHDGTKDFDTYENKLQKIENSTDDVLRKICSHKSIEQYEKSRFARYIQNMYKRTETRKDNFSQLCDKIKKDIQRNIDSLAKMGDFMRAKKYLEMEKCLESPNNKKLLFLKSMVITYLKLHQTISSMTWKFYIAASNSYFVTSKAPVLFEIAIGLQFSSLLFPISKTVVLIATHKQQKDLEFKSISTDETEAINYYIIRNAKRVYAPKAEPWIHGMINHQLPISDKQLSYLLQEMNISEQKN